MGLSLAIIGSRSFNNFESAQSIFKDYFNDKVDTIISGGAKGADFIAKKLSNTFNKKYIEFPADWYNLSAAPCKIKIDKNNKKYNVLAGFNRNKDIINNCNFVLAFFDGVSPGTKNSLILAKEKKINTMIVYF